MKNIYSQVFAKGTTMALFLGVAPAVAVATNVTNSIGLSLAVGAVLILASTLISLGSKFIPQSVRFIVFIAMVAGLVSLADIFLKAHMPELARNLGIFIPLIVVNVALLARMGAIAYEKNWVQTLLDALGMSIRFLLTLTALGAIRELLGNGTLAGVPIFNGNYQPVLMMIHPAGGLIVLGLILGIIKAGVQSKEKAEREARR